MSSTPLNVLLVEDNGNDADRVVVELKRGGYQPKARRVDSASSLRSALQAQAWDVILCGYTSSQLDGRDVLRVVRDELALDTPVIFISGGIGKKAVVALMQAGAQDHVLKSNLAQLPLAIRRELDASHARQAKKQADERIEEQDRQLRQLMESVPDAIYFKDLQLRYTGLNEAECRVLRAGPVEAVLGRSADEFLTPERARRWREEEERVLATGEPLIDSVERMLQEDGTVQWFSMTKAPLRNRDGEVAGLVGISRDVTERQINAQMRDEFVSTVSHELRTPLTSITGSLGLLAAGAAGALPDSAMHLLKIAHGNCERLVRLTNDILDLQHIEREAMDADADTVEVRRLVEKAIEANSGYAETYGVTVRLGEGGDQALVRADPDRLIQVVTNLLSNAIKFSPHGAEGAVTVAASDGAVRLSVRDHGPGIPKQARGRIFEKFFQVDASDSRQKGGTGLGLAIVKQIVDHLGGRVGFEPAPGGGTLFTVVLPQAENLAGAAGQAVGSFAGLIEPYQFDGRAAQEIRLAMGRGAKFCLLRLALDGQFEQLVATRGQAAGDAVLKSVARCLRERVRGEDILCHTGDGRVSVLLRNISLEKAFARAEALRAALMALRVAYKGERLEPVSVSIGLAVFPGQGDDLAVLSEVADQALDRARADGGGLIVVASDEDVLAAVGKAPAGILAPASRAS